MDKLKLMDQDWMKNKASKSPIFVETKTLYMNIYSY